MISNVYHESTALSIAENDYYHNLEFRTRCHTAISCPDAYGCTLKNGESMFDTYLDRHKCISLNVDIQYKYDKRKAIIYSGEVEYAFVHFTDFWKGHQMKSDRFVNQKFEDYVYCLHARSAGAHPIHLKPELIPDIELMIDKFKNEYLWNKNKSTVFEKEYYNKTNGNKKIVMPIVKNAKEFCRYP